MTEVYKTVSDQEMTVCCPFPKKKRDAPNENSWRQGPGKQEGDALDLLRCGHRYRMLPMLKISMSLKSSCLESCMKIP